MPDQTFLPSTPYSLEPRNVKLPQEGLLPSAVDRALDWPVPMPPKPLNWGAVALGRRGVGKVSRGFIIEMRLRSAESRRLQERFGFSDDTMRALLELTSPSALAEALEEAVAPRTP